MISSPQITPNPNHSSSASLYPSLDNPDLVQTPSAPPEPVTSQETLIQIPNTILHLIDSQNSIELATGQLTILCITHSLHTVAVLARVGPHIQFPLSIQDPVVKLDPSHYFISLCTPQDPLNYGLTVHSFDTHSLDSIFHQHTAFSIQAVSDQLRHFNVSQDEIDPVSVRKCEAYWTVLAPNVEDYTGKAGKLIATGSGQLIKGILWCGDVTVERLNKGNDVVMKRITSTSKSEIRPETMKRIKRVKKMTKITEKVATGVLSGVVKISGVFTSSVVNSKIGKKFLSMLPGEVILASLDGFNKVCDAIEVAGKHVMSTSSTMTTGLVTQRYGEEAGHATGEGLQAAGHAMGTAWTAFKIRKAINPKSVLKPSNVAKTVAKSKKSKDSK